MVAIGLGAQATGADAPVLGQPLSVATPSARTQTQVRALAETGARVEELRSSQAVVRAYVAPSGMVFGLAWQGLSAPDLEHMLGAKYQAFRAEVSREQAQQPQQQARARRGPLYVHVDNLVVEMSGHMRDHRGRAYLTDAIPANLTPAVIQ